MSATVHHKLGSVDRRLCLRMAVPGVAAGVLMALSLSWLSLSVARPLVRVILLGMGALILYRHAFSYRPGRMKLSSMGAVVLGFILQGNLGGHSAS